MSRLLVDDVTKTDARALLNVNKMATISDIVAPSNEYIYASGANELTVVEGCKVIALERTDTVAGMTTDDIAALKGVLKQYE